MPGAPEKVSNGNAATAEVGQYAPKGLVKDWEAYSRDLC